MEVKINKEIRNYTESMFFGLSMRQFIFSVLACGVAVGLYFLLRPQFGTETLSWMCILGASPLQICKVTCELCEKSYNASRNEWYHGLKLYAVVACRPCLSLMMRIVPLFKCGDYKRIHH